MDSGGGKSSRTSLLSSSFFDIFPFRGDKGEGKERDVLTNSARARTPISPKFPTKHAEQELLRKKCAKLAFQVFEGVIFHNGKRK